MSRKPDYRVAAMDKDTNAKAQIGAAWLNKDGSISVTLEAFVVVQGGKQLLITLFPNDDPNADLHSGENSGN